MSNKSEQIDKHPEAEWTPGPAESFDVEYLNTETGENIRKALMELGFNFESSGPGENKDIVIFNGRKKDGTKITITIEKGVDYNSPAELAEKENE